MGAGPVATVEEEDDAFAKTSPGTIFLFTKGSISSLVNLIEALNHFYKFCKNSGGLSISTRSSTKIGVAI